MFSSCVNQADHEESLTVLKCISSLDMSTTNRKPSLGCTYAYFLSPPLDKEYPKQQPGFILLSGIGYMDQASL